tara:strand:- start:2896 stop:3651 length:756 start_codon:yes stop_codon:yes gene_type:complete
MRNRTVLVTGGGSGVGRSIAHEFAASGARVLINDIRDVGEEVANNVGGEFLKADLSDQNSVSQLAEEAIKIAGRIDILVNNAGTQHVDGVDVFPDDIWVKLIHIMLVAPFLLTKQFIPAMKENRWGRIINISSIHGLVASPFKSAYVSAKHGLVGLTKSVALEVGEYGITVNAICPGYTRTPLVEAQIDDQARTLGIEKDEVVDKVMLAPAAIKELIDPDDIAKLASFLASEEARLITGSSYSIDAGWTAR